MKITDGMAQAALDVLTGKIDGCAGLGLSDFCDDTQCACKDEMRAALEVVAPLIAAQARREALEEAARVARSEIANYPLRTMLTDPDHADRVAAAIRALAATVSAEAERAG